MPENRGMLGMKGPFCKEPENITVGVIKGNWKGAAEGRKEELEQPDGVGSRRGDLPGEEQGLKEPCAGHGLQGSERPDRSEGLWERVEREILL